MLQNIKGWKIRTHVEGRPLRDVTAAWQHQLCHLDWGQSTDPFPWRLQCLPHCPPPHRPCSVLLFAGAGYSLLPHRASLNGVSPSPGVGHTPVPYPSCSVLCNAFAPTVVVRLIPMSSCHQTEWTSYVHALSKLIMWCWSWQPHSWSLGSLGNFT